jgi:hypothetical protein
MVSLGRGRSCSPEVGDQGHSARCEVKQVAAILLVRWELIGISFELAVPLIILRIIRSLV